ncbi:MAG: molecular chaperone DnaJ [Syntrophothermus sp.]
MAKRDYYEVLGLDKNSNQEDIKKAYRKMAMKYHPDRNPDDKSAEENFKEAAEAYEVLSNDEKRARYDRFGHEGVKGSYGNQGFSDLNDIFSHFSDIFSGGSIFDDFFGGGQQRARGRRRSQGIPGSDLRVTIKLTLEEISQGSTKKIKIKKQVKCDVCSGSGADAGTSTKTCPVCQGTGEVRSVSRSVFGQFVNIQPCNNCGGEGIVVDVPCRKCKGDGRVNEETTEKIDIPAGVHEGHYMTLQGKGNAGKRGGPSGDLIVIFQEVKHQYFKRDGDDIIYELQVTFPEAALGGEIEVPTLTGRAKIKIDSGTHPGKMLKMKDKGIKHYGHGGSGDQIIIVNIKVPSKLSSKEKELLKELSEMPNFKKDSSDEKNFFKMFS